MLARMVSLSTKLNRVPQISSGDVVSPSLTLAADLWDTQFLVLRHMVGHPSVSYRRPVRVSVYIEVGRGRAFPNGEHGGDCL